jgi:sigma-B regulation protein RsbU (phosphoserine phosphatase)
LVLGILPHVEYCDGRLILAPGETLFLYTDGITEATAGRHDDEFGGPRLHATLLGCDAAEPELMVQRVLGAVRGFTGGADPEDDLTILVLQRNGTQSTESRHGA